MPSRTLILRILFYSCILLVASSSKTKWPVPYRRHDYRPVSDPFCKALYPFCPTGLPSLKMPIFDKDDTIEIYALKAPVWEFKFGKALAYANIMHDAIGFRNSRTKINYTMEWYELFQLFNCTFPHFHPDPKTLLWCNQGAACIYQGIDDKHWKENGTLALVGKMTGSQFNEFSKWAIKDNQTGIFYETWTVKESPEGQMWFDSYDCASFVLRAFQAMADQGAIFRQDVHLNYTRINLFSKEPQYLGNITHIRTHNATIYGDMLLFYTLFQGHLNIAKMVEHLVEAFLEVTIERKFYFYYNSEYWFLPMKSPFISLTYTEVPLPKSYSNKNNAFRHRIR